MTRAHLAPPRAADRGDWDLLVDEGTRIASEAIETWAATAKGLVKGEAGAVMAAAVVNAATWWFDWAKTWQELPFLGGAGGQDRRA